MNVYAEMAVRLALACLLGGVIGIEREYTQRPAGFRTHMLVCVGACLVMITSEFMFGKFGQQTNMDPARLGAQVISGIGFLGAGTIIRDGFNVKGLTTAASLWAVSCVGIAVGIGFYSGAVTAAILIFVILLLLKKTEKYFVKRQQYVSVLVESENLPGQVGTISEVFAGCGADVKSIEFIKSNTSQLVVRLSVRMVDKLALRDVFVALNETSGVQKVLEE